MDSLSFAIVAVAVLGFGLVSRRLQRSVVTMPMVFVAFGLLVSERGLGLVHFEVDGHLIHLLAELTLVLVLFTDASRIDLGLLRRQHNLPIRMLAIGLPLTVLCGALVAVALFANMAVSTAVVLAIVLAPTDAALGQAVVGSPLVPRRIRQALNVESGLNDGIVLPLLLIALSVACATVQTAEPAYWIKFTAMQLIFGPLVGIGVGYLGGLLVAKASRQEWMDHAFQELAALSLSILSFALAHLVGGNGFIAAFCAGLVLGNASQPICACLYEFAEAEGQLLTLIVFMIFGAILVPENAVFFDGTVWLYAALSLTLVRALPVALSLIGTRLHFSTVLFLGWFGPRGLASVLFALLVLEDSILPDRELVMAVVMATVLLSVFTHGLTAFPGARWYSARLAAKEDELAEDQDVTEMPVRHPYKGT